MQFNAKNTMKTLKEQVRDYLEAQRPDYGDEEVAENLKVLEELNDDLSSMDSLRKTLVLRLIDDTELYIAIESAYVEK
ncbi:MAG: hypothetical protein P8K68_12485 [Algibacter sp.]|uniref:hypothetical protein n=1 Tax=Algibacter sp. TaxID=1872428 RepID=UPI0026154BE4|nr:hypothetical protein [Algibacter sp.]MDG1729011.1 hypothetical protein [Algibacter sp.]MDG2179583.1 hypothetical protein [Algibacter sp.]